MAAGGYRLPRGPRIGFGAGGLPMLTEALGVPLPPGYSRPQNDKDRC